MADQGRKLDCQTESLICRLRAAGLSIRATAREARVSTSTAYKILKSAVELRYTLTE